MPAGPPRGGHRCRGPAQPVLLRRALPAGPRSSSRFAAVPRHAEGDNVRIQRGKQVVGTAQHTTAHHGVPQSQPECRSARYERQETIQQPEKAGKQPTADRGQVIQDRSSDRAPNWPLRVIPTFVCVLQGPVVFPQANTVHTLLLPGPCEYRGPGELCGKGVRGGGGPVRKHIKEGIRLPSIPFPAK